MRYVTILCAMTLWLLGASPSVFGQSRGEIQVPQEGFDVRLAAAASPNDEPKTLVLAIDDDNIKGDKGASLALVEFTDFQ
jgi:hypothetical protein